jgi:hypothetical protein
MAMAVILSCKAQSPLTATDDKPTILIVWMDRFPVSYYFFKIYREYEWY